MGWYCPCKILNSSSRIHFNWFNRINFKLILLTLLFNSFLKTNLNCRYVLLLDIFPVVAQWGFCKYLKAYSSCFMHAIVTCMRLPFLKIFSNCVHFSPNFQIISTFFWLFPPFFWKIACIPLIFIIDHVSFLKKGKDWYQ